MARRTKEEALETRERLLDAALDTFCEKGFSQTRLADVAERIGMTRGALYWHFKNKSELFAALFTKIINREEQLVRLHVPQLETLEDLKAHFTARAHVLKTDEKCRKFFYFVSHQVEWTVPLQELADDELDHLRDRLHQQIRRPLETANEEALLNPGADIGKVADVLVGQWIGLAMCHMRGMLHNDLEQVVSLGFRTILDEVSRPREFPD